jgi:hypothetical protein
LLARPLAPSALPHDLFRGANAARVLARRAAVDHARQTAWAVTELDARGIPGARGATWLVFDSADAVRRVWAYPGDWRSPPDVALVALSLRR